MKKDTLMLIGAAGIALYLVNKAGGVQQATTKVVNGATEVLNSLGQRFNNGWRYFSDGTAIDPFGSYYKGGTKIWSPAIVKQPTADVAPSPADSVFQLVTTDV